MAEDTEVKLPDYDPNKLSKMNYRELQELAKAYSIPEFYLMNEKQLRTALGATPDGAVVYDRAAGMKDEQLRAIRESRSAVPGKTIYFKKDQDKLDKIWARDPLAFNGVDMTDPHRQVVYHFDRKVKCACGDSRGKFLIQREWYENRREGQELIKVKRIQKEGIVEKYCPHCGRKHIYLDPDKEYDPAKVRAMEHKE